VAALTSLATLHGLLGQHELAERALAGVSAPEAEALTARLRFAAGDLASAERLAAARLSDEGEDVRSLNLLAQIALRRGEDARSLSYLRRALRARPSDPEAQRLLANLEENRP
jgi:Tfp pilus assembly protein PilF